jgi:NADH-quinone oxidoreductase subunit C
MTDVEVPAAEDEVVEAEPEAVLVHGCPTSEAEPGTTVVHCTVEQYLPLMKALRTDGWEMCVDVTAVDYLTHPGRPLPAGMEPERFEVVAIVRSLSRHELLRVRCQVPGESPEVPTLFDLWPGTEAMEREVFDLMGIRFTDHPDLTRILMPDDWEGHPLRKDYAQGRIPVQFKVDPGQRPLDVVPSPARGLGEGSQ